MKTLHQRQADPNLLEHQPVAHDALEQGGFTGSPEDTALLGLFSEVQRRVYSNGAEHVYGKNAETGKLEHISHEKVAENYGHTVGNDQLREAEEPIAPIIPNTNNAEQVDIPELTVEAEEAADELTAYQQLPWHKRVKYWFGKKNQTLNQKGIYYLSGAWKMEDAREMKKERRRTSIGLGILAVGVAYASYKGLIDHDSTSALTDISTVPLDMDLGVNDTMVEKIQDAAGSYTPAQEVESLKSWTDTIAPGDGITQTFIDYAQSSGQKLSPEQAWHLFQAAQEQGLITEDNISNITSMDTVGGVGYQNTGKTELSPDIIEFLNKNLK